MHPLVKILYFVLILLLISYLNNQWLCVLFVLISVVAVILRTQDFVRLIRRMRWLFLSVLIIYAFATPGQYVSWFPVSFAPTIEGVQSGLLQMEKLLSALAALTLLYANSHKDHLILGLYMLMRPFKYIGLNAERFAVRLFLTLEYVEEFASQENQKAGFDQFDRIHQATENPSLGKHVTLAAIPLSNNDKLLIVVFVSLVLTLLILSAVGVGQKI